MVQFASWGENKLEFLKKNIDIFCTLLISIIVYLIIFGFYSLDVNNYNICLRNVSYNNFASATGGFIDISIHYLGSILYRLEDFGPQFFIHHNIGYPYGISVLNTDSIPIFALIFKILYKFFKLTPYAQYFGILTLLCFILQGFFSVLILRELKFDKINTIIASMFLVLSPIMIVRTFEHSALSAHFLILMALYLYIKDLSIISYST